MIGAQNAIRLGVRAATRNPELAFAKTLLDLGGTALSVLPAFFVAVCAYIVATRSDLSSGIFRAIAALQAMSFCAAGALGCALLLSWALGTAFWSGALPLLAADAELSRRPPPGNFFLLAGRGFSRVVATSAAAAALGIVVRIVLSLAALAWALACLVRPTVARVAALALALCVGLTVHFLLDLLADLWLVRSAALGDRTSVAFGRAASLLGRRLSACLLVSIEFAFFDLLVALVAGGVVAAALSSANVLLDPQSAFFSVPARVAASIAFGAVFAWLEVARKGSLAAIAADDDGLIEGPPPPPSPPPPVEPVVEALPAPEEQVVDALPVPEEEVVEALPVPEDEEKS
ncbi:MAG: hypothetical protein ACJ783_05420 [Myxococcales bacterium]